MYSFATTKIKATCSRKNLDLCDDEQKAKLDELMSMSVEELEQSIEKLDALEEEMNTNFDDSTDELEEEYLAMVAVNEKAKKETKASVAYDAMKSILVQKTKTDGNDEL
jgi:predicted DNA-binding ArsR family transcriptional regulator